jgi:uncharacterized protein (TIGR01777 family)
VRALKERGHEVVATGRDVARLRKALAGTTAVEWDPRAGPLPQAALEGVDGVVNLAGEPILGWWTRRKRAAIRESRVAGTRHLVAGLAAAERKPKALVSVSAVGYYGDTKHNLVHEDAPPGTDFLAEVCQAWEAEAGKARELGIRTALVRMGVVLGRDGGAYPKMTLPLRTGLGGTIGLGRFWMSWIHVADAVGALLHCLESERAHYVYNATAPNPCSNLEFTRTFGRLKRRPTPLPVPPVLLRALYGGSASLLTMSQRVRPVRTLGLGYVFRFPRIALAIADLEGLQA